jgi:hypothetical protein
VAAGAGEEAESLAALERRKFRAGDDGEVGAGSGASQANAAAETAAAAGSVPGDTPSADGGPAAAPNMLLSDGHPVPVAAGAGSLPAISASRDGAS